MLQFLANVTDTVDDAFAEDYLWINTHFMPVNIYDSNAVDVGLTKINLRHLNKAAIDNDNNGE